MNISVPTGVLLIATSVAGVANLLKVEYRRILGSGYSLLLGLRRGGTAAHIV